MQPPGLNQPEDSPSPKNMETKMKARSCSSHIPPEIVFEKILVRVPAKSLMRFKLVCKLWESTILYDRRFHQSHRSLSPSRPSLLAFIGTYYPLTWYKPKPAPQDYSLYDIILTESGNANYYRYHTPTLKALKEAVVAEKGPHAIENRFVCSSLPSSNSSSPNWEKIVWEDYYTTEVVNGLVCFYSKNLDNLFVCNLSTSETMKLSSPHAHWNSKVYNQPRPYYFGFDDISKVYKLLQVQEKYSFYRDNKDNSKILTLEYNDNNRNHNQNQNREYSYTDDIDDSKFLTGYNYNRQNQNCWRNTSLRESVEYRRSYCFKSTLYWIVDYCLVCYDLNKEEDSIITYPLYPNHDDTPVRAFEASTFSKWNHFGRYYDSLEVGLTQVRGRLALTHSCVGATEFNIWLLDYNPEKLLHPTWDKITIQIPIHLKNPCARSFLTVPVGPLPGTNKIVITIGRVMLYKPLVGFYMPVYTYDLESETWETFDNDYLPAAASSIQPAYKDYSQMYYFHEDNILPLKDILGPK